MMTSIHFGLSTSLTSTSFALAKVIQRPTCRQGPGQKTTAKKDHGQGDDGPLKKETLLNLVLVLLKLLMLVLSLSLSLSTN